MQVVVGFGVKGTQVKVPNVTRRWVYYINMSDIRKIITADIFVLFKAINAVYASFFNIMVPLNINFSSVFPERIDLHKKRKASNDSFPMVDEEIQFGLPRY